MRKAQKASSQTSSTDNPSANAAAGKETAMTSPVLGHQEAFHRINNMSPSFGGQELASPLNNLTDSTLGEPLNGDGFSEPHIAATVANDHLWNGRLLPASTAERHSPVSILGSHETGTVSHGGLLTTNEEISSFEFPTPVSGHSLQNMATNNGPQCDVDMEVPNQTFDDFWYWLGDFGNDMQGMYGSFESQSNGLRQLRTADSTEYFGGRAGPEPRDDSTGTAYSSDCSEESPDASSPWPLSWTPRQTDAGLPATEAAGIDHSVLEMENFAHVGRLSFEKYEEIVENLESHANQPIYQFFGNPVLPSAEVMNSFIQLYFEHFHDTMPFVHKPSFDPSKEHWILVLAITATGCRFSRVPRSDLYALKLTELVRRSIMVVVSQNICVLKSHPRYALIIDIFNLSWK